MAIRNIKLYLILFSTMFLAFQGLQAQFTQTIRGTVNDQLLQQPIAGATVTLGNNTKSVITAEDGSFRFTGVPVGLQHLQITHATYKMASVENITVNAGKEIVLNVNMEPDIKAQEEVIVKANSRKNKPLNELSLVSTRAFTVDETQRYAAAVNDPLRMATSFSGVVSVDDGSNDIVIRGNSPTGMLWRMEGVDIPNPNHFSVAGNSGGGISILNAQLLANSDFSTGAFAAEYGNALSGVFDLKLRKGNNEKREYTIQAGILGLNLAAEGPFSKKYKGSYLINYRYSTLELLDKIGVNVADGGVTRFQDLSYNIYLPTNKAGNFSLFGFAGLSSQDYTPKTDSTEWETESDRYGGNFISNTAFSGLTHDIELGRNSHLKSAIGYSKSTNEYEELYAQSKDNYLNTYNANYETRKWNFSSTLNKKIGLRHFLRTGVIFNLYKFQYYERSRENPNAPVLERINTDDNTQTIQAFAQWQYKPVNSITVNAGMHYIKLLYNNSYSIEPRAAVKWDVSKTNTIGFGYGLHGQIQSLGIYFAKAQNSNGQWYYPNKDLGLTRAHHFVFSYGHSFGKSLRLKTELYYQHLFNVPISPYDTSTLSTLNVRDNFITDPLVNKGKGRNYGVEITLEKNLRNYFYFLLTTSIYKSLYTAADGIERNTRFNGNYVSTFTAGKEFVYREGKRSIGLNIKMIYAGGFRETPIDLEKSMAEGYTVRIEKDAFSIQNPNYFRTDIRVSMKWNKKHHTTTLSLDIQNVSNRQNLFGTYFDPLKGGITNRYQTGLIPILNYKVEF